MPDAHVVLREDGSISYALADGARAVSGLITTTGNPGGAMSTRSVEVHTLPDGSTTTRETHVDGTGKGDYTTTTRDPQGNVTDVEHGTISTETHFETDVEGHTVKVDTTTTTKDPDAQGDSMEITTSHSEDLDTGRTTDAKSITVTDPSGEVIYQDKNVKTSDAEGNWSEVNVETSPDTGATSVDTRTGDKDGNEYHDWDGVDKDGNPQGHQHDEKHPQKQPDGDPEPADPEPSGDPEPGDPEPGDPEPGDPDGGPGDSAGRPADDGTSGPRGPGGLIGKLIQDFINKRTDEGDGDENAPGLAPGRPAHDLGTAFGHTGADGSEGPGVVVDLRVPVPPGAVDDWGDHNDPRMNTGFAALLTAVVAQLQQTAARAAR